MFSSIKKMLNDDIQKLSDFARENKCITVIFVTRNQIAADIRTVLKCYYGCPSFGTNKMCPPYTISPERFFPILKKYKYGLLVETSASDINQAVVRIEKEAIKMGYLFAFGMRGGACPLCPSCTLPNELCCKPVEARPSMEALGIDVFKTVKNAGINKNKLASLNEDFTFFGLILID